MLRLAIQPGILCLGVSHSDTWWTRSF